MKLAHDLSIDRLAEPSQEPNTLASWYAPGLSDELGDRLLMFDNSSAPSLELLRFKHALTASPGFEVALRRRVERLSHFRHPSFATVRSVEYLGPGDGLALLSNHTPGKRLSEVLQHARGTALATALIQQLTPALARLQQYGEGGGHGALAPSRIIVTPEGRLMIVEHVLGPALERLQLSASRLRSELAIAVPPTAAVHFSLDSRTDYFQLGLIALSLLLGRRVGPDESQESMARLLEQVGQTADRDSPVLFRRLRAWLERALQLDDQVFESSGDAEDALDELTAAGAFQPSPVQPALGAPAPAEPGAVTMSQPSAPAVLDVPEEAPAPPIIVQASETSAPPSPLADEPAFDVSVPPQEAAPPAVAAGPEPAVAPIATMAQSAPPVAHDVSTGIPEGPGNDDPRVDMTDHDSRLDWPASSHGVNGTEMHVQPEPAQDSTVAAARVPENTVRGLEQQAEAALSIGSDASQAGPVSLPQQVSSEQAKQVRPGKSVIEVDSRELQSTAVPDTGVEPIPATMPPVKRLSTIMPKTQTRGRQEVVRALVYALAMCVIGEAFVIAGLILSRSAAAPAAIVVETSAPGADVLVDGRSAGVTPLQLEIGAGTRSIRVVDSRPQVADQKAPQPENRREVPSRPDVGTTGLAAAAPRAPGGIRVLSPIDVEVFEGDRRLGSSATGIVSAAAGRHQLDLVNSLLGYRARQTVDVRPGQVVSVQVSPPNGRLSINALPWAEVWIGGKPVGETPLGNLSIPPGEHEIIFRHPQLGEHRRTAVVRVDGVTRVSANLQR